ncbi:1521_t:CDS:2 [Paraglomus occultum]|uniref:1521_t:CDS:1 n=1 Tax=Paraglomus occultum TaxID=144539 RepID=A0A9N9FJD8_9GLOM|nr:1521_t:CDS:2 [Paraglomus occultum]
MDKFGTFYANTAEGILSPSLADNNNNMLQNVIPSIDNKHLTSTSDQAYAPLDQCEQTSVNTMNPSMTNGIVFGPGYNFITNNVNTFQTEQQLDVMQEIRQLKTEMLAMKRENDQLRQSFQQFQTTNYNPGHLQSLLTPHPAVRRLTPSYSFSPFFNPCLVSEPLSPYVLGPLFFPQPDTLRPDWQCMGCDSKTRNNLHIHEPILKLYCSMPCYNTNKSKLQTRIITIDNDSAEVASIKKTFCSSVKGAEICLFARLEMPKTIVDKHNEYKKRFAEQNQTTEENVTQRMFHGTKIKCTNKLSNPEVCSKIGSGDLCKELCGLCGIIQYGVRTEFSRFGNTLWFAGSPMISHSYCGISNPRAMFVVDVVATTHSKILTVNRNEATLPRYLILFQASRKRTASQSTSSGVRIKRCKTVSKEQQLNFR